MWFLTKILQIVVVSLLSPPAVLKATPPFPFLDPHFEDSPLLKLGRQT